MRKLKVIGYPTSSPFARKAITAFMGGVVNSGDNGVISSSLTYENCDVAVIFGEARFEGKLEEECRFKCEVIGRHRNRGLIVLDASAMNRSDTGYAQNYLRIGINSFEAQFGDFNNKNAPPDRWQNFSRTQKIPYPSDVKRGESIYLLLQTSYDASIMCQEFRRRKNYTAWVRNYFNKIKKYSNRDVIIRPHPKSYQYEPDFIKSISDLPVSSSEPIGNVFKSAWATVSHTSSSGVEFLMRGVPSYGTSKSSFVNSVFSGDISGIDSVKLPRIDKWLNSMCYVDWSIEETKEGLPYRHLKNKLLLDYLLCNKEKYGAKR